MINRIIMIAAVMAETLMTLYLVSSPSPRGPLHSVYITTMMPQIIPVLKSVLAVISVRTFIAFIANNVIITGK